jgi:hypothetical protein
MKRKLFTKKLTVGTFPMDCCHPTRRTKDNYFFKYLNDNSSGHKDYFEEGVVEERKSPTTSQEESPSSPPMEWRKQPPESLSQSQESLFVHPPGETTPLAINAKVVDVCDFVLQDVNDSLSDAEESHKSSKKVDTEASSKTVFDTQSDSAKVSHKSSKKVDTKASSKTVFDLQSESDGSDTSSKEDNNYWKTLIT